MKPIIINGPMKYNEDIDLSGVPGTFMCSPSPKTLEEAVSMYAPTSEVSVRHPDVAYYAHQFGFLGHRIVLYATQRDFHQIPFDDLKALFDIIISDRGKAATAP